MVSAPNYVLSNLHIRVPGRVEWGQLRFNKMKVLQALMINVKNNKLSGITSDFHDVNKILKNLLDEDDINDKHKPTIYVHQFPYRYIDGRVFNIMHFFNSGSLPANIVLMQLTHCIMACEAIGCQVMGLVCDAAGSIQKLYKYLR